MAKVVGSTKLQKSKETLSITKQGKLANHAATSFIFKHFEGQVATKVYKTSNIVQGGKPLIPAGQGNPRRRFGPGCDITGKSLDPRATSLHGMGPIRIKLSGPKTRSVPNSPHENESDCDPSAHWDGLDSVYNIPIWSHRNRASGTEYFAWNGTEETNDAGFERGGQRDWDEYTEPEDSQWNFRFQGEPPQEPRTRDGVPLVWERHQDLLLWASRGTIDEVRQQMQLAYDFTPPISEEFLLGRLTGRFAPMHLQFLLSYLPGEISTIQRARDRTTMYLSGAVDPDITAGQQPIQAYPMRYGSPWYQTPPMPDNAPIDWEVGHDAMLNLFVYKHPIFFYQECEHFLPDEVDLEFLQIRMAQSIHLGFSVEELRATLSNIYRNSAVHNLIVRVLDVETNRYRLQQG